LKPESKSPAHLAVPSGSREAAEETEPAAAAPALPPPQASADWGQQELQTAQHFLYGTGGHRDTAEAAKWLWRAVGKQNGPAILLLSDLYAKGDGVSRNCDQARLLLLTAVKKKVPDSASQLRRLELSGCR
jgi:TPR repeat protein